NSYQKPLFINVLFIDWYKTIIGLLTRAARLLQKLSRGMVAPTLPQACKVDTTKDKSNPRHGVSEYAVLDFDYQAGQAVSKQKSQFFQFENLELIDFAKLTKDETLAALDDLAETGGLPDRTRIIVLNESERDDNELQSRIQELIDQHDLIEAIEFRYNGIERADRELAVDTTEAEATEEEPTAVLVETATDDAIAAYSVTTAASFPVLVSSLDDFSAFVTNTDDVVTATDDDSKAVDPLADIVIPDSIKEHEDAIKQLIQDGDLEAFLKAIGIEDREELKKADVTLLRILLTVTTEQTKNQATQKRLKKLAAMLSPGTTKEQKADIVEDLIRDFVNTRRLSKNDMLLADDLADFKANLEERSSISFVEFLHRFLLNGIPAKHKKYIKGLIQDLIPKAKDFNETRDKYLDLRIKRAKVSAEDQAIKLKVKAIDELQRILEQSKRAGNKTSKLEIDFSLLSTTDLSTNPVFIQFLLNLEDNQAGINIVLPAGDFQIEAPRGTELHAEDVTKANQALQNLRKKG
ncbi:MAG: hypothetical protein OXU45_01140, partial [Candidatus Melainabacteria bacterium]|nr:hypothetical protein [Candidatus Melainabacteria bacterium]